MKKNKKDGLRLSHQERDDLSAEFRASDSALLDLLRSHLTDTLLDEIANADYGYKAEENQVKLREIRENGTIPVRDQNLDLHEVLILTRWAEPSSGRVNPRQLHLIRAFACTILFRFDGVPANTKYDPSGCSDTVMQLLESLLYLGREYCKNGIQFLVWAADHVNWGHYRPSIGLAILLLVAHLHAGSDTDLLERAVALLNYEEKKGSKCCLANDRFGLSRHDLKYRKWVTWSQKLLRSGKVARLPIGEVLAKVASRVSG